MKEKGLKTERTPSYLSVPTPTHMAISYLYNQGKIQYVTSQNTDGLHVKSGIKVSEFLKAAIIYVYDMFAIMIGMISER